MTSLHRSRLRNPAACWRPRPSTAASAAIRVAMVAGAIAIGTTLAACTNPYDPGQRAVGGGLLGAGGGAALGAIAGGGHGAAIGALTGGALGALGGAATTPNAPRRTYQSPPPGYSGY